MECNGSPQGGTRVIARRVLSFGAWRYPTGSRRTRGRLAGSLSPRRPSRRSPSGMRSTDAEGHVRPGCWPLLHRGPSLERVSRRASTGSVPLPRVAAFLSQARQNDSAISTIASSISDRSSVVPSCSSLQRMHCKRSGNGAVGPLGFTRWAGLAWRRADPRRSAPSTAAA